MYVYDYVPCWHGSWYELDRTVSTVLARRIGYSINGTFEDACNWSRVHLHSFA